MLIVGAGGLGCPAALHLAAAGVGTIGLIDGDTVEPSNLHRQVLYRTADLGRPKVEVAAARLRALNPALTVRAIAARLAAHNLSDLFRQYDFVIDGSDGIATKYLVNDGAVLTHVPYSHAGIVGFAGQTMTVTPGRSTCLRCVFPVPPAEDDVPTCQATGIIGALAGSLGVVQATEAVKYLLGVGTLLTDRLLTYDARASRWRAVPLSRAARCPLCGTRPTIRTLHPAAGGSRHCQ